jgi:hypothetical protein
MKPDRHHLPGCFRKKKPAGPGQTRVGIPPVYPPRARCRPDRAATPVWLAKINVWMTDELCARIAEGFQDEAGFHYGPMVFGGWRKTGWHGRIHH